MSDPNLRISQPVVTTKQNHLKRRVFLRQSAASVLAAGLLPGARPARAGAGTA